MSWLNDKYISVSRNTEFMVILLGSGRKKTNELMVYLEDNEWRVCDITLEMAEFLVNNAGASGRVYTDKGHDLPFPISQHDPD